MLSDGRRRPTERVPVRYQEMDEIESRGPDMGKFGLTAALTAIMLGGLVAGYADARVGKGREVRVAGKCSARSTSKLKLKLDDGRIETEFEVDQNRNGQRWRVVLTDNGATVFRGVRRTRPPSGSFEVERRIRDRPGRDRVVAMARKLASGERCRAVAQI